MREIIVALSIIFILLLLIPINIDISKNEKTVIKLRVLFISIKIPKLKGKGVKINNIKNKVSPLYCGIKYLLSYSNVKISTFELISAFELAQKPYLSTAKFISISSLLAFIAAYAKKYDYNANRYIVTEDKNSGSSKIEISVNFFSIRLIISLILVAYYKIKNAIKARVNYV